MVLEEAMDQFSSGDTDELDRIIKSVGALEITPEMMQKYLPNVDWNKLALVGRSGPECQARWLNSASSLINNSGWSKREDKLLLYEIQRKGIHSWGEIASLLGTNRTPFQCLERFQRSLNARVLNKEWTKEEDAQLKAAVCKYKLGGELIDWQSVAATLIGRTGVQCSNRWEKSLDRLCAKGRHWNADEDKRLKLAVKFFGPKDWKKVASFVPGRKDVQCRERWHNACSPSLNRGAWTEEEDSRLKAAVEEHGRHSWSKVSQYVPGRTDNDCMRRWKILFPQEVPLLKEARKIKKAALITNFVDREEERPTLGIEDFGATPLIGLLPNSGTKSRSKRRVKEPNGSTDKEAEAPSLQEKGISTLRPHCNRHQEQETGHEKDSASDNSTLSSLRTSKKRKRKLEVDNVVKDDVQGISDSEATISTELECQETSSHMTIDSTKGPVLIHVYSRKRHKIHQKHDYACVSNVTS
ncbi:Myb-like protein L [Linum grandiflorum]